MTTQTREQQIAALEKDWATNPRWKGIKRGYIAADVVRLRGSFQVEHTLARRGAEKLWNLLQERRRPSALTPDLAADVPAASPLATKGATAARGDTA